MTLLLQDAADAKNAQGQIRKITIKEKGFKIVLNQLGQQLGCTGLEVRLQQLHEAIAGGWTLCWQRSLDRFFFVFIHYIKHLRKFKSKQLHLDKVLLLLPMSNEQLHMTDVFHASSEKALTQNEELQQGWRAFLLFSHKCSEHHLGLSKK